MKGPRHSGSRIRATETARPSLWRGPVTARPYSPKVIPTSELLRIVGLTRKDIDRIRQTL